MVAHGLAIALWLGSLALYGAAFFFPEVHRRHDFFWSGVAAFYGLVLWFDAVQISSVELLGHGASLALLGWFGWQTLSLRRKRTPLDLQTPLTPESWPTFWGNLRRSLLALAKATPLGRWLPEAWEQPRTIDPALAVSEIRVSSLKEVDYEFVDALAAPETSKTTAVEQLPAPAPPQPAPVAAPPRLAPTVGASPALGARAVGLGRRVAGWFKVKPATPKREVIDIPSRPSPLGRKQPKREVIDIPPRPSPLGRKQPKREVIDIPPRPSPLGRKRVQPSEEAAPPSATATPETVIAETVTPEPAIAEIETPEINPPEPATPEPVTILDAAAVESEAIAPPPPPAEPGESNWDDEDSNWIS